MRILIATSILPSGIGGPAVYSKNLMEELEKIGHDISVISGNSMRHLIKIMLMMRDADVCYALSSSPKILMPSFVAARLFGTNFAIRIAGDFLWERAMESGKTKLGLAAYYREHKKTLKEKLVFLVLKYIFKNSDVLIFNSKFQKDLYDQNYGISSTRCEVIENAYPRPEAAAMRNFPDPPLVVMYAGRLLKLKNLATLIRSFGRFKENTSKDVYLKIFGEGPQEQYLKDVAKETGLQENVIFEKSVSHEELFRELKKCWLAVLPSYSDISPNFAFECCAYGAPIIISEENYLPQILKKRLVSFDPHSVDKLAGIMADLSVPKMWEEYQRTIMEMDTSRDFSVVAQEHIRFFESL